MLSKSDCIALALNKRCAYNYVKVNVIKTRQSINLLKKKNQNTPRNGFEKNLYGFVQILEPES